MLFRLVFVYFVFCLISACGGSSNEQANSPPNANANPDISEQISAQGVSLNGNASTDPDGDNISYFWEILSQPTGANASLSQAYSVSPTLISFAPGEYEILLTVTDSSGASATDTVSISLSNTPPEIIPGILDPTVIIGGNANLDASASNDVNGQPLTFIWTITGLPAHSQMDSQYTGATPNILFDVEGDFIISLEVSDGYEQVSYTYNSVSTAPYSITYLSSNITDAEYNETVGKLVSVFGDTLDVIDSIGTQSSITLPYIANAVSISPDGMSAAVGHNGYISHIDLEVLTLVNTYTLDQTYNGITDITEIVLDGRGQAHGFNWNQRRKVQSVNFETGSVYLNNSIISSNMKARLHPSGSSIYGANNGVYPDDLARLIITDTISEPSYDSPYHGDYPFCGDLWMGPAGEKILSRCRVVVNVTENKSDDMTYYMQLDNSSEFIHYAASSAIRNRWYVIDQGSNNGSDHINVYDIGNGDLLETRPLPFTDMTETKRWFAKFVFADNNSDAVQVVAWDDPLNPQSFALIKLGKNALNSTTLNPEAIIPRYLSKRVNALVEVDATGSINHRSQSLSFQWTLLSEPVGGAISPIGLSESVLQFYPSIAGTYEFALKVNDGKSDSPVEYVSINIFEVEDNIVHRLEGDIIDVGYSKPLNMIIYISGMDKKLYFFDISSLTITTIELNRIPYQVGVSADGLKAAISHAGMVSLIDLQNREVLDTEFVAYDWGDIVLDNNSRAHFIPKEGDFDSLISVDFLSDSISQTGRAHNGATLSIHPNSEWIYSTTNYSTIDLEKWDVSSYPSVWLRGSPYFGEYEIGHGIWISENGDKILTIYGNVFHSSLDANLDMAFATKTADAIVITGADHSSETNQWVVLTRTQPIYTFPVDFHPDPDILPSQLIYYTDDDFSQITAIDFDQIPTNNGPESTSASHVFLSDDGEVTFVVLQSDLPSDKFAISIIE